MEEKPRALITKAQALDDFIERRVMGDDPFGISVEPDYEDDDEPGVVHPGNARCVYMHSVGGGCVIGKWIPEDLYSPSFELHNVRHLFDNYSEVAALFEHPESDFWKALQEAHDGLALYLARRGFPGIDNNDRWSRFQNALRVAGDLA